MLIHAVKVKHHCMEQSIKIKSYHNMWIWMKLPLLCSFHFSGFFHQYVGVATAWESEWESEGTPGNGKYNDLMIFYLRSLLLPNMHADTGVGLQYYCRIKKMARDVSQQSRVISVWGHLGCTGAKLQ